MSNIDLDKSGRLPQNVKTYLGPTTGWKYTDSPVDIEWCFEGGGGVILNGLRPPLVVPDWLIINNWIVLAPANCSVTFDIWKTTLDAYIAGTPPNAGNSITGTEQPKLTNQLANSGATLAGWTTQINQNDVLAVNVSGVVNCVEVTLILRCIRSIGLS